VSRRLRLVLIGIGGFALAVAVVALIAVYLVLQPDRFTAMLQAQARDAGLELNLDHPASPTLFPRPALDLQGITLSAQGANAPILFAEHGLLVLPWRTLFGGPTVITQLKIESPRVDLDALQAWLSALPAQPERRSLSIPRIDTGISISHGSLVRGDQLLLGNVGLEAGCLASGLPFPLSISATTDTGTPLQLRLSATPRINGDALLLDDIALHLELGSDTRLNLTGNAHWHGASDAAAALAGKLVHADASSYDVSLQLMPQSPAHPLLFALKLDGPDNHADLRLPPLAFARWWRALADEAGPQLSIPPGDGSIQIGKFELDGVSIEGFSMQAGDAVPASAGSAATGPSVAPRQPAN
jgi:AsmA protein